jgi:thymidylate kinase
LFKIDTELLNVLFDLLNEKMDYLVLRNHQGLPESNNAKDVDILVASNVNKSQINLIVKEVSALLKANIIWINELDYLSGFVLARQHLNGHITYAKLDFFYGLKWRGLEFCKYAPILDQRVKVKNYYIPAPGHEALIHIVNGALYGKSINKKYFDIIHHGIAEHPIQFSDLLMSSGLNDLHDEMIGLMKTYVHNQKNVCLFTLRKKLIKALIKNQLSIDLLVSFTKSVKTEIITRRKFGYLLSFSGPDGAGKSSIMESVIEFFQLTGICKQEVAHHFLPEGIPPLHRLLKFNKKLSKQNYTQPYSEKPVGKISSAIRFLYYVLAFIFAKYKYLKPQFKRNEVVIFDRYYPDLIADPTRARLSLSRELLAPVFSNIAAVPDVALVFVAEAETLIKRKGELTETKATQLVKDYRGICKDDTFTLLENDGTLADGLSSCFYILFSKLDKINIKKLK